jgi:hypothetical protein
MNPERQILRHRDPLLCPGGEAFRVKTVYLGLGQAWTRSARGEGVGLPGPDGWRQPAPVAADVGRVLEILQNKSSPKFIPLPVTIQ